MNAFADSLRPSIRARLTLVYGGLFLLGGVGLLALTYLLVNNSLPPAAGFESRSVTGAPNVVEKSFVGEPPPITGTAGQADLVRYQGDVRSTALNGLLTQGAIALGVVTALTLALGWLLADRALRPVHRITETARRVARSHDLTERIAYTGPRDDVKELADTFDTMLGRLARAFDAQRRFIANASHELRTPLAINRTLVDVAVRRPDATADLRRLGESLLVVNGRHERLIDGLLTLAGSEHTVTDHSPVDLSDVTGHVADQAAAEAGERRITVTRTLGPAPTAGDPVLVERLVQNLVENGVRHNRDGGELSLLTRAVDGRAEVVVSNTGPVVPPYELEAIFEPFRRLGTDRVRSDRGAGLGLSIVRAIATAHGGSVTALSRPGGGLIVTVRLPAR
ncbi:sensor histidine kinase [Actinomadura hibisca]|uniref:sensor histidine kinase n=1 Tax=Actinomadura hibisca TaxID=68565 RepID=UPI0008318521|nr:HAMP domain-containing sensor histidine kinase [Actinomadura hibisca]